MLQVSHQMEWLFVWVPCSVDKSATDATDNGTTVTYEKVNGLAKTWSEKYKDENGNLKQNNYITIPEGYTATSEWKDDGGNTESVAKYGGFYIARFEAGLPESSNLWERKDGAVYGWTNGEEAGSLNGNRNENISKMIPVSKKNNASWNRISQKNAVVVSKEMYEDSKTVTSSLIDSYAWDTVLAWYTKTGMNCINSTRYGNYTNSSISLIKALYTKHIYINGTSWKSYARNYTLGNFDITPRYWTNDQDKIVYEIATGSSKDTEINHVYDLAGNMWEWTTEIKNYKTNNDEIGTFAVRRGGSFNCSGEDYPVVCRLGYNGIGWVGDISVGFRVVLYITL